MSMNGQECVVPFVHAAILFCWRWTIHSLFLSCLAWHIPFHIRRLEIEIELHVKISFALTVKENNRIPLFDCLGLRTKADLHQSDILYCITAKYLCTLIIAIENVVDVVKLGSLADWMAWKNRQATKAKLSFTVKQGQAADGDMAFILINVMAFIIIKCTFLAFMAQLFGFQWFLISIVFIGRLRLGLNAAAGWAMMKAAKALLLSFLLLTLAVCHGWTRKCERITIHLCQDIGYNLTVMPNLMGHEDQLQADRGHCTPLKSWSFSRCSKDMSKIDVFPFLETRLKFDKHWFLYGYGNEECWGSLSSVVLKAITSDRVLMDPFEMFVVKMDKLIPSPFPRPSRALYLWAADNLRDRKGRHRFIFTAHKYDLLRRMVKSPLRLLAPRDNILTFKNGRDLNSFMSFLIYVFRHHDKDLQKSLEFI
ncbi:hypothetical protein C0J52_19362 [Blattella germanica]|nr:hypothetical protein C0J52_19362 [Blattella germanica]